MLVLPYIPLLSNSFYLWMIYLFLIFQFYCAYWIVYFISVRVPLDVYGKIMTGMVLWTNIQSRMSQKWRFMIQLPLQTAVFRYSQSPWVVGYYVYAYIGIILYWFDIAFLYVVVNIWRCGGFNMVDIPVNTLWWWIFWRPLLLLSIHWQMQCSNFPRQFLCLLQQKCPINNSRLMPWSPTWRGESTMPHARPLTPN